MSTYLKRNVHKHWKLLGLTTVILLALASSAYAYWRINTPSSPTLYVKATSPPLELRMELEKTEFQLNETIQMQLYLKNIDEKPVRIAFAYINFIFGFVVKDVNDTRVFLHPRIRWATIKEVILESGGQLNDTLEWVQEYNQEAAAGQPFKTGTYKITGLTGTYYLPESVWSETDTSWGPLYQIETPSMTVAIG